MPDVRNVTHLHGAAVQQSEIGHGPLHNSDGWPDAWIYAGRNRSRIIRILKTRARFGITTTRWERRVETVAAEDLAGSTSSTMPTSEV